MTTQNTQNIENMSLENIKVVDKDLIDNYTIVNHDQNENHYIVINTEDEDNNYIDYLLLNVNISDYLKDEYYQDYYLNDFDLKNINGFLYIEYNSNEIYNFLDKNNKYFTDDLKSDLTKLFNVINDEIDNKICQYIEKEL